MNDDMPLPRAAARLRIAERTLRTWCQAALHDEPSRLRRDEIMRTATGRYYVKKTAVDRLKNEGQSPYF